MKIEFYERVFIVLSLIMLGVFVVFLFYAVQIHGIRLASPTARVDPATLLETPPFDNPGVEERAPGQYMAVMVARMWRFEPREIRIPAGSTVTFQIASPDVIHGFFIPDTDVNIMVLPGEVSTVVHTFEEPGEYLIECHEYCGTGHQSMSTKIIVEDASASPETEGGETESGTGGQS